MKKGLGLIFIFLIRIYQKGISPYLMPVCRYNPSCSEFGVQAIIKYGPFKGGYMTLKRFISCNPWGGHGHNPVP
ncbi:MAG: membrane protein insertion efficiency factor YidD [Bacteroidota bacterium]